MSELADALAEIKRLRAEVARLEALWLSDPTAAAFRARDEAITDGRRAVARSKQLEAALVEACHLATEAEVVHGAMATEQRMARIAELRKLFK